MTYRFGQKPGASRFTSYPPTAELGYVINGIADRSTARAIVGSLIAPAVAVNEGILYLQDIRMEERGFALYDAFAMYAKNNANIGSVRFKASSTGGTFHIDAAPYGTVASYAPSGGTAADFGGLINADDSDSTLRCEGTDVVIPQSRRTLSVRFAAGIVSEAFAYLLDTLTGHVNSTTLRNWQAGEALFLGWEGEQGTDVETTLDLHFAIEKNLTGLTFGPSGDQITGVDKQGHDLLWTRSQNYKDTNGKPARKVIAVYVERIYPRSDLSGLIGI